MGRFSLPDDRPQGLELVLRYAGHVVSGQGLEL